MDHAATTTTPTAFLVDEFQAGVTACLRSWSALRTAVDGGWGGAESAIKADDLRDSIYQAMLQRTNPSTAAAPVTTRPRPSLEAEDLEDNLAIYMEEEFSVVLEDGSEKQVSETIFRLYEECAQGRTTLAEHLVGVASKYDRQIAAAFPVQIQSTEHDDDDDDDDDDDAMMDTDEAPVSSHADADAADAGKNFSVLHQAQEQLQQQMQLQPTAAAGTPGAATFTAAEYAAQSLFGKPKKPKVPRKREETPEIQMDDDGFATVTKGRRKARS